MHGFAHLQASIDKVAVKLLIFSTDLKYALFRSRIHEITAKSNIFLSESSTLPSLEPHIANLVKNLKARTSQYMLAKVNSDYLDIKAIFALPWVPSRKNLFQGGSDFFGHYYRFKYVYFIQRTVYALLKGKSLVGHAASFESIITSSYAFYLWKAIPNTNRLWNAKNRRFPELQCRWPATFNELGRFYKPNKATPALPFRIQSSSGGRTFVVLKIETSHRPKEGLFYTPKKFEKNSKSICSLLRTRLPSLMEVENSNKGN